MSQNSESVISEIVWPDPPSVKNREFWESNVALVKMLCHLGKVIKWQLGVRDVDTYVKMPYRYKIHDVEIEFLPHWAFYAVGGINLHLPSNEDDVLAAVAAVEILQRFGLERPE